MRRALAVLVFVVLPGCTTGVLTETGSGWERIASPPLSPRVAAVTFSHEGEAFVVGGDTAPCPANAQCVVPDTPPLADGAAYDAKAGTWRRIADAPVPFEFADVEVVGETAYFWITAYGRPGTRAAFLAYRIAENRWDELSLPPAEDADALELGRAGDRVVALATGDAGGPVPEHTLDPATETWSKAPPGLRAEPYTPAPPSDRPPHEIAGWVGRYSAAAGFAFDEEGGRWVEIEPLDDGGGRVEGRAVASAGRDLLVVGGVRWGPGFEPRLLDDAWLWRAPPG